MPVWADVAIGAKTVELPGVRLQDVKARISNGDSGTLSLALHAAKADLPALGWKHAGVALLGTLQRDEQLRWQFDGRLQMTGTPGAALTDASVHMLVDEAANNLEVDFGQGKAIANAAMPMDQPSHVQITLKHLPAGWLQGLLSTVWAGQVKGGQLDAELALDVHDTGVQTSGQFNLDGVGFDSPAGTLAGQSLSGGGRLGLLTDQGTASMELDASLRGGQLLVGPLYARLPAHPVQLGLDASVRNGAIALTRLHVADPDALQLDGSLGFDAKGSLQALQLDRLDARFPTAYQRYGQAWLSSLGLPELRLSGQLSGGATLQSGGWRSFAFRTDGLDIADAAGNFGVSQLRGGLDWAAQGDRPATTLGWRSLQLYRMENGAAQGHWQSRAGELALQRALDIPVLKGHLRLGELGWRPAAASGQRLALSLALTDIDMAAFSRAMGWPEFPGTLGGAIPALRWIGDRIELQGGLSVNVFDGFVDITRLSLQQPFGDTPVLAGDIQLRQLDLGAMTSVFDFGNITGRMDGSIDGLRLVGWNPVAFNASLLAAGGGRISQRAVNNLTSVGGGGIAGGLQGAVLKLFKTFGYKRIGLNCVLQADVCQMSGLDNTADGYTILAGSGLPRLQIVGHQNRVDWPTLVRRLKEATEGAAPVIR